MLAVERTARDDKRRLVHPKIPAAARPVRALAGLHDEAQLAPADQRSAHIEQRRGGRGHGQEDLRRRHDERLPAQAAREHGEGQQDPGHQEDQDQEAAGDERRGREEEVDRREFAARFREEIRGVS